MKRSIFTTGLFVAALFLLVNADLFAKDPIYKSFLSNQAVDGYDAVAYFTEGKPVQGKKEYRVKYQGADWYFSSVENLSAFKADPQKYAPQYGGYCAWAVAQGSTAKGDPNFWSIHDDKLYLNYDSSIQDQWLRDRDDLISKADRNWPDVIK
jgi:YHS domain-containing protein